MPIETKKPLWRKAFAFCPLCWWSLADKDVWPEEFTEKVKAIHAKDKPNCHETLKIEGFSK